MKSHLDFDHSIQDNYDFIILKYNFCFYLEICIEIRIKLEKIDSKIGENDSFFVSSFMDFSYFVGKYIKCDPQQQIDLSLCTKKSWMLEALQSHDMFGQ